MTIYRGQAVLAGDELPAEKSDSILIAGADFRQDVTILDMLTDAGITLILAESFAPEFIDVAIPAGISLFTLADHRTESGDRLAIDTERGIMTNDLTGHEVAILTVTSDPPAD